MTKACINYIELHRTSDHTDPRVQAIVEAYEIQCKFALYEQNVFRSNHSQTVCSASGRHLLFIGYPV